MSFDDLAFSAHRSAAASAAHPSAGAAAPGSNVRMRCQNCDEIVVFARSEADGGAALECPFCGSADLERSEGSAAAAAAREQAVAEQLGADAAPLNPGLLSLFRNMSLLGESGPAVVPRMGGAGGGSSYGELVAAQRGVDVEELMAQLLSQSDRNAPPTKREFLSSLLQSERRLERVDFVRAFLRVPGVSRPLYVLSGEFGAQLTHQHDFASREDEQVHCSTLLVPTDPIYANGKLENPGAVGGCIALTKRGVVSFVDKANVVQAAGAVALVVIQDGPVWPYKMTDKANKGGDVRVPCVMVSAEDGDALLQVCESGKEVRVELATRQLALVCPVCRDDLQVGSMAVSLPCQHAFCKECIEPWLLERNTCPLCRYELPTEKRKNKRAESEASRDRLHNAMFT